MDPFSFLIGENLNKTLGFKPRTKPEMEEPPGKPLYENEILRN